MFWHIITSNASGCRNYTCFYQCTGQSGKALNTFSCLGTDCLGVVVEKAELKKLNNLMST